MSETTLLSDLAECADEIGACGAGNEAAVVRKAMAEIASLRAQLDEARAKANIAILDGADLAWKLDEARRKAIEDAANTAEQHSRLDVRCKCGFEIAEDIRALLSESKT